MKRKTHSVLWDLLLVGLLTFVTSLCVPFVGLMPLLSASLDLRSGRWTATGTMVILALGLGYYFYGPLGLACAAVTAVLAVAVVVMYRKNFVQADGLLYSVLGGEILTLVAAVILTRLFGNLSDALLEEMVRMMNLAPESFQESLATMAVVYREGLIPLTSEFETAVNSYMQWDYQKLLDAALPMLSNMLSLIIPTVIFVFGLIVGGGTWLCAGYAYKAALAAREEKPDVAEVLPVDFGEWYLPRILTMPLMLLYLASVVLLPPGLPNWGLIASQIVQTAAQIVLSVQGAALLVFFLSRRKMRMGARWAWVVGLGLIFPSALFFAGCFDAAFRFRQMMLQQEEMIKEAIRRQQESGQQSPYNPFIQKDDTGIESPYATPKENNPEDDVKEDESAEDERNEEE